MEIKIREKTVVKRMIKDKVRSGGFDGSHGSSRRTLVTLQGKWANIAYDSGLQKSMDVNYSLSLFSSYKEEILCHI